MTHRDTTPTVIPTRPDHKLRAFERVAAAHPDESPWAYWRRVLDRVEIARTRVTLRHKYVRRGNRTALFLQANAILPAVIREFASDGSIVYDAPVRNVPRYLGDL